MSALTIQRRESTPQQTAHICQWLNTMNLSDMHLLQIFGAIRDAAKNSPYASYGSFDLAELHETIASDIEAFSEPSTCGDCHGSGEGWFDGTTCRACRGLGEVVSPEQRAIAEQFAGEGFVLALGGVSA